MPQESQMASGSYPWSHRIKTPCITSSACSHLLLVEFAEIALSACSHLLLVEFASSTRTLEEGERMAGVPASNLSDEQKGRARDQLF